MAHQYTVYKHSIKAFPEDTCGFIFSSFLDGNIWRDEFTLRQLHARPVTFAEELRLLFRTWIGQSRIRIAKPVGAHCPYGFSHGTCDIFDFLLHGMVAIEYFVAFRI